MQILLGQPPPQRTPDQIEAAIRAALDKPFSADFDETSLTEIAAEIYEKYQFHVVLYERSLDGVGIGSDTPITFVAKNISLRSGLHLILKQLELAITVRDESLVITTPEAAFELRVYDVSDLARTQPPTKIYRQHHHAFSNDAFGGLIELLTLAGNDFMGVSKEDIRGAELGGRDCLVIRQTELVHAQIEQLLKDLRAVPRPVQPKKEQQRETFQVVVYPLSADATDRAEALVKTIQTVVEPDSWTQENRSIATAEGMLVVKQTPAAQQVISKLLKAMNALPIDVDYYNLNDRDASRRR